jgi:hypothetical protein
MRSIALFLLVACGASDAPSAPEAAPAEAEAAPAAEATAEAAAEAPEAAQVEAPARDDEAWKYFGEPFMVAAAQPAKAVFATPDAHAEAPVRIVGEFTEVCQKMGCWAVVRDGEGHSMRITMKDHAFGIDKDAMGKACDVEGTLVSKKVDPERLAHFESEGATDHPEAGQEVAWSIVASSVAIARQ